MRCASLLVPVLLALLAALTACAGTVEGRARPTGTATDTERRLVADYFARSNAAARAGSAEQQRFFAATQHPDYRAPEQLCRLDGLTVLLDPTLSTVRPAPGWRPGNTGKPPRGSVLVVAVRLTVQQDHTVLGEQVASVHVVLLEGRVYGFAPCPA